MMKKQLLFLTLLSTLLCAESFVKKIELGAEGSASGAKLNRITCEDNTTVSVYKLFGQWHDKQMFVWGDANETIEDLAEFICAPEE